MPNQVTQVPMPDRFWSRVENAYQSFGCWTWTGAKLRGGYGSFYLDGRSQVAHRVAWAIVGGTVPEGMELDHLCGNRLCVRPSHLEPVTRRENVMRSASFSALNARKETCPKGHPYSGDNVIYRPDTGARRCRTCRNAAQSKEPTE